MAQLIGITEDQDRVRVVEYYINWVFFLFLVEWKAQAQYQNMKKEANSMRERLRKYSLYLYLLRKS